MFFAQQYIWAVPAYLEYVLGPFVLDYTFLAMTTFSEINNLIK